MYRHFPLLGPFFLLTIHLLFSQQCHPIYYTADLNDHLLVEGAPQKGMYGSIVINGNVGQQMDKQKHRVMGQFDTADNLTPRTI